MHQELTAASRAAFEQMMQDLGTYRHPLASDTRHPLYRCSQKKSLRHPNAQTPAQVLPILGTEPARYADSQREADAIFTKFRGSGGNKFAKAGFQFCGQFHQDNYK
jgi:hypothetical protein